MEHEGQPEAARNVRIIPLSFPVEAYWEAGTVIIRCAWEWLPENPLPSGLGYGFDLADI
jgi:hypothetical protein